MSFYHGGRHFRPKKRPRPETRARRRAVSEEYRVWKLHKDRLFAIIGGEDTARMVGGFHRDLARALDMTLVHFDELHTNEGTYVSSVDFTLICVICIDHNATRMKADTLAKRLKPHLPAIRAAIALGGYDDAVTAMIHGAIK